MRKLLGRKASSGCLQYVLLTRKLSLWYVAPLHDPQTFEFYRNQCLLTVTLSEGKRLVPCCPSSSSIQEEPEIFQP